MPVLSFQALYKKIKTHLRHYCETVSALQKKLSQLLPHFVQLSSQKKSGGLVSVADADEKWFSLFMHSDLWAVNVSVVDPNVFSPFFQTCFTDDRLSATQRKPAVVHGWPELPDSHYWGSRKIHTLMWRVLLCVDKGKKATQQRTVTGQRLQSIIGATQ